VTHLSASSFPPRASCRRAQGTKTPRTDQLGCRTPLKAWPFRPGRSEAAAPPPRSASPSSLPVVYPATASSSGRVHDTGESPSALPCAQVVAASLPPFPRRSPPSSHRSTRGSPVHRSASTPSTPTPSRRRR
jgi:hypothetical protein